jgi:hypothetical protein
MSQHDQFPVTLPSNVPGNVTNKPGAYETTLAVPLELPGTWEVSLIDITYPHTWLDLDAECVIGLSTTYPTGPEENVDIIGEENSMELIKALKENVASYSIRSNQRFISSGGRYRNFRVSHVKFRVERTFGIVPGKYKLKEVLDKLQREIRTIGTEFENAKVEYNKETDRVHISEINKKLLISSYSKTSIFPMLGYENDIKTNRDNFYEQNPNPETEEREHVESPSYTLIDYILVDGPGIFDASLPPKLSRINEIFVYTDIIDTVLVGNTQAPMLGYFPVQSKWGFTSYLNFNPPYYVKVKENTIRTISIKLCDETGETIRFESGTVICRLNFRRIGLMRGLL